MRATVRPEEAHILPNDVQHPEPPLIEVPIGHLLRHGPLAVGFDQSCGLANLGGVGSEQPLYGHRFGEPVVRGHAESPLNSPSL